MSRSITFRPVFIEPKFEHRFLTGSFRYGYLVLFELAVAALLIRWFLGAEARETFAKLRRRRPRVDAIAALTSGASLRCTGPKLMLTTRSDAVPVPALNYDGSPVEIDDCSSLLRSVNGP
ncbi:entry and fusion IMV protein [Western grey kangaroopox virus]|uniref:Entry and fusion IMV protein n=1 Tax=Western grey kangaroopox virus TaxID=1566307 RepID=A0A2C9DSM6_9POXV|nr:entry and fusion IMV protein [Western grey kangaroopox virus]ATI21009.1 entry and fusion IMV protein [Western grey kangaroopox virus]